jgi:hypothetical protein
MQRMVLGRRRLLASLFLVLACVSFAGSVCKGWQATGMERMACCAEEDHACTPASADTCCATAEQRQHATVSSTPVPHSPLVVFAFAPLVPIGPDFDVGHLVVAPPPDLGSRPPTHLLLSVFLI